jgi:hypothetical protein
MSGSQSLGANAISRRQITWNTLGGHGAVLGWCG